MSSYAFGNARGAVRSALRPSPLAGMLRRARPLQQNRQLFEPQHFGPLGGHMAAPGPSPDIFPGVPAPPQAPPIDHAPMPGPPTPPAPFSPHGGDFGEPQGPAIPFGQSGNQNRHTASALLHGGGYGSLNPTGGLSPIVRALARRPRRF